MVAMLTEDMLVDLGFETAASASGLAEAMRYASECDCDVALLDANLRTEKVFPVADELLFQKTPFAFATGYGVECIERISGQYRSRQYRFCLSN